MPPNQRRLAENDALVEIIQTTEYLDDVPTWGQRDYRLYPPRYSNPFYRGRGRGRREWLQERQMERPNIGFGRGNGQDNNMRSQQQTSTDRPQPARQEDEWSLPPTVERGDDAGRRQTTHMSSPATPPPTEERLFTDWSSEGLPRERDNQQIQSARSVESRRTVNQTEQIVREQEGDEVLEHVLSDVTTVPSTQVQISQVSARFIDHKTNTSEIEIRPPREEARIDIIHVHSQGIQVPSSSSELSSHNINMEESVVGPHVPIIMPQLDGPASVHMQRKQPLPIIRRTTIPGEGYPDDSGSDSHYNRFREGRRYPGRRRYYQERGGRPPDRDNNQGQGYLGRGRPLMKEDPLMMEDPLMVEDPLMMEDPQEMEDHQEDPEDKDHQAHQDLLDQCIL